MQADQFYLTLLSNRSFQYYPNNKISEFTTQLQRPLTLTGVWEAGLSSILYPRRSLTITRESFVTLYAFTKKKNRTGENDDDKDENDNEMVTSTRKETDSAGQQVPGNIGDTRPIAVNLGDLKKENVLTDDKKKKKIRDTADQQVPGNIGDTTPVAVNLSELKKFPRSIKRIAKVRKKRAATELTVFNIKIPKGYYDVRNMVDFINEEIEQKANPIFKHKKIYLNFFLHQSKLVSLSIKDNYGISFGPEVADLLGYDAGIQMGPVFHLGSSRKSRTGGPTTAYIYCDIIEEGLIGDTSAPLLRVIPTWSADGGEDISHWTFPDIQYRTVSKNYINTIGVLISDREGENIPFEEGTSPSVLCLHFRRNTRSSKHTIEQETLGQANAL